MGCHVFKLCTKLEQNQTIPPWLSYYRFSNFLSRRRTSKLHSSQRGSAPVCTKIGRSELHYRSTRCATSVPMRYFVFKRGRLKDEGCRRSIPNFTLFDPCKNYRREGGMGQNAEWEDRDDSTSQPVIYIWWAMNNLRLSYWKLAKFTHAKHHSRVYYTLRHTYVGRPNTTLLVH